MHMLLWQKKVPPVQGAAGERSRLLRTETRAANPARFVFHSPVRSQRLTSKPPRAHTPDEPRRRRGRGQIVTRARVRFYQHWAPKVHLSCNDREHERKTFPRVRTELGHGLAELPRNAAGRLVRPWRRRSPAPGWGDG